MFFESILPKSGDTHTVIFLRWGKGGRLDPHAGEVISMRDSYRDFPLCPELLTPQVNSLLIWATKYQYLG